MHQRHLANNNIKQATNSTNWDQLANNALCRLASSLISSSSIDEIAGLVLSYGKQLTGSKFGFAGYIDPVSGYLVSPTLSKEIWKNCRIPNKEHIFKKYKGLWGWVLKNKKPLLTNSPASDPRSTGTPKGHIPIHRFISAPAVIGENLLGIICLANSERDYDEKDLNLIIQMARLYALAIDRKRTVEELYEAKCRLEARVAEQTSKLREINLKLNLELEERKRTEKNLEQAIHKNKLILESVGEGIYVIDRNGTITFANPVTAAITGYAINEIIGKKQHDIFHHTKPDGSPFPVKECPIHMTLRDGKTRTIDNDVFWKKDGTSIPIEYTCTAILEDDEIVGAVIAVKDISERLKSQKALEESEKLYKSLVHQSSDGIFILDPVSLKIKEANNQLLGMLGYSYKDLSHLYLNDIVSDDLETIHKNIGKILSNGRYKLGPHYYIRRDGSFVPVEASSSVIQLGNTQLFG